MNYLSYDFCGSSFCEVTVSFQKDRLTACSLQLVRSSKIVVAIIIIMTTQMTILLTLPQMRARNTQIIFTNSFAGGSRWPSSAPGRLPVGRRRKSCAVQMMNCIFVWLIGSLIPVFRAVSKKVVPQMPTSTPPKLWSWWRLKKHFATTIHGNSVERKFIEILIWISKNDIYNHDNIM